MQEYTIDARDRLEQTIDAIKQLERRIKILEDKLAWQDAARVPTLHGAVKPTQDGAWFCPRCANTNPRDWLICVCCDLPRPS